jgi:type II secretion system protein C
MRKGSNLYIRKVFFAGKLAFVIVLVFVIVKTVTIPRQMGGIFVPSPAAGTETVGAVEETMPAELSIEDYSAIVARNIFGDVNWAPSGSKFLSSDNAGGTMKSAGQELGLALVGTVCGSPEVSRAIIKDVRSDILNLYRVGQAIGDACVESIEKNAVVLLHNGQRKTLTFTATSGGDKGAVQVPSTEAVEQPGEATEPDLTDTDKEGSTPILEKIGQVESTLEKAVIEPYVVKSQVEGLKITGLEGIIAARDLGLKNGDIICAVNGQRLTSKQKAYQIFKKARSQTAIDIELLRNGKFEKLSFTLR